MNQRVVGFLGYSFTNGNHWSSRKCHRELVAERLAQGRPEARVVQGMAGHTKNGVGVLEDGLLPRNPELIFVFPGADDCAHQRDEDSAQRTLPTE